VHLPADAAVSPAFTSPDVLAGPPPGLEFFAAARGPLLKQLAARYTSGRLRHRGDRGGAAVLAIGLPV